MSLPPEDVQPKRSVVLRPTWTIREPNLAVTPACMQELKPLLYQLYLLKQSSAPPAAVRQYTSEHIIPVWEKYELHKVHKFPDLYTGECTSQAARSAFRQDVRNNTLRVCQWIKIYERSLSSSTSSAAAATSADGPLHRADNKTPGRADSARELYARMIKADLDLEIAAVLKSEFDAADWNTERMAVRNRVLSDRWEKLGAEERARYEDTARELSAERSSPANLEAQQAQIERELVQKIADLMAKLAHRSTTMAVFQVAKLDPATGSVTVKSLQAVGGNGKVGEWYQSAEKPKHDEALRDYCLRVLPRIHSEQVKRLSKVAVRTGRSASSEVGHHEAPVGTTPVRDRTSQYETPENQLAPGPPEQEPPVPREQEPPEQEPPEQEPPEQELFPVRQLATASEQPELEHQLAHKPPEQEPPEPAPPEQEPFPVRQLATESPEQPELERQLAEQEPPEPPEQVPRDRQLVPETPDQEMLEQAPIPTSRPPTSPLATSPLVVAAGTGDAVPSTPRNTSAVLDTGSPLTPIPTAAAEKTKKRKANDSTDGPSKRLRGSQHQASDRAMRTRAAVQAPPPVRKVGRPVKPDAVTVPGSSTARPKRGCTKGIDYTDS